MNKILLFILLSLVAAGVNSCIEDDFTTSPSDQPTFSVETLDMGVIFTEEGSTTHRFTVYNRASKSISISRIALSGENAGLFRLNIDGLSGETFSGVEIRGNDSIYVFVDAKLPANGETLPVEVTASLDFTTNGETRSVVISAQGQDVTRLKGVVLDVDTRFEAGRPYVVYDSLVVSPGVRLELEPGATLCFHDKAYMAVRGTLVANGTPEAPVTLSGDRTGNVVADISFDLMSNQWTGVFFTHTSRDNVLTGTIIKNTSQGVIVDGDGLAEAPVLTLVNCRLRNSGDLALEVYHAGIRAVGCEFAEASNGVVYLQGGSHVFNHCTFANYYLFTALGGPILQFAHIDADSDDTSGLPYTVADFSNSIVYGNGTDLSHGDFTGTGVTFRRCLLKSEGADDDNFLSCIWGEDPLFYTVREDYIFDYRLREGSPAIGAADPSLTLQEAATDGYGLPRGPQPDLGAYVFTTEVETEAE